MRFLIVLLALSFTSVFSSSWEIRSEKWSESHEKIYRDFIVRFGNAVKDSTHSCRKWRSSGKYSSQFDCFMSSPDVNRYRPSDDIDAHFYADCADCAYVLRAYVAYKEKLPFTYVNGVKSSKQGEDTRYSSKGNYVTRRFKVKEGMNPFGAGSANSTYHKKLFLGFRSDIPLIDVVSTAMYRIGPVDENGRIVKGSNRDEKSDFYPLPLSKKHIQVGSVIYKASGHASIVHSVDDDGTIYVFQCHTEGYVSHKPLKDSLSWSRPTSGAAIKEWRPVSYKNEKYKLTSNNDLISEGLYSVEQFNYKNEYVWEDSSYKFLDFIKTKISGAPITYNPIKEFSQAMDARCDDLKERADAVESALVRGLDQLDYPWERLPRVIYQTSRQPWENISTPARDLRIRASLVRDFEDMKHFLKLADDRSPQLLYEGSKQDLAKDLLDIYFEKSSSCLIEYKSTNGEAVSFDMDNFLKQRLYNMSFDPYHCIERRWGAKEVELFSCDETQVKKRWYDAQSTLRNTIIRNEEVDMNWNVSELEKIISEGNAEKAGAGIYNPKNILFEKILKDALK